MHEKSNKYLITAILLGLAFHGTSVFFTIETTYDALIHLFFADHYASSWLEPWNYKWYTGFTVMSYPPLVHQAIGALSLIAGVKFGLFTVAFIAILLFVTGVYRFSLLMTSNRKVAGYASILAVLSSSFVETLHLFGQLPSIVGVSVLMHALPEIYLWLKTGKIRYYFTCISLISVTVTSHHVTPIFGMIFFIFPLIGMAIMDAATDEVASVKDVTIKIFIRTFFKLFRRIVVFGFSSLVIIVGCILPYWINSKKNPITQVPIPHGSRDNFLEVTSSGLVFFLIPWGIMLILLPYIFYRFYSKRYWFFGLSLTVSTVLGTGGTTPIPLKVLGETAFNILTLDRFTLWASIMSLPLFGEFAYRFVEGDLKDLIQNWLGSVYHRIIGGVLAALYLFMTIFTMSLGYFRPSQPQKIKMLPIVNFLYQDQHDHWRYMTLGFGDQMAWLSAQTKAMSVDGNYHSARRLPELTTRPIERLENSKFRGLEGIGSLQQFLTTPEKYHLKYIFSNDKFYDPILYFCGWQRLQQLENGIMVWEKLNVPPAPSILPKEDVSLWLKVLWGMMPLATVLFAFILNVQMLWLRLLKTRKKEVPAYMKFTNNYTKFPKWLLKFTHIWGVFLAICIFYGIYLFYIKNESHHSPENAVLAYYDALDFKRFEDAHNLLDPDCGISIAQYMLQVSVTDGLLSSYAKMDGIKTTMITETDSLANMKVEMEWITPLERMETFTYKSLVKKQGKWYLLPDDVTQDLPPDQLYSGNLTEYFNQGRRRITTEQTHHEDILKQPVLEILSAKLVKNGKSYSIIGDVQNIDNVPADVVLKGTLYNDDNKQLATYNAKHQVKHKIMPKEVTAFRINFEGIAWSKTEDSIPKTFNPDEFTPIEFEEQPTKFNLQIAGNTAKTDLYKSTTVNEIKIDSTGLLSGILFNSGLQEVTIPQLIISYYNADQEKIWVDHKYIPEGIRQQRKLYFEYKLLENDQISCVSDDMTNCFVNGLPNGPISDKIVPNRIRNHTGTVLQPVSHQNYSYIKIELNTYVGNPK